MLPQSDKIILQLLVVKRAKQTKATLAQTGEWPLGWVDWGYQTKNGKTLIQIHDALPDGISAAGLGIAESIDDFFFSGGNLNSVSDESEAKTYVVKTVSEELAKNSPAQWALDLAQSPLSSPSFRQGYIRPSICKWNWCCPNPPDRCPFLIIGTERGLYYDTSISQAYNSALDELFVTYPLEEAVRIFKNIATINPLVRFASSADIPATPSKIHERLYAEMKGGCLKYVPWSNWKGFGLHIDYLKPDNFLGPNKTCPDYKLAPELTKDKGGAYPEGGLLWFLKLVWGDKTDEVEENKFHLITIPDAMGQSISEIQQFSYDTRDTLAELESVKDFNADLSNTVDDEADLLYAGMYGSPASARRYLGLYPCNDSMFSAQKLTSIEQYSLGTRFGCNTTEEELVPEGKCDGQLFGKLLESGKYQQSSAKGETYFNTYIKGNLTPELMNTYAAAEAETGVPCEILAGIHFVEAGNSPDGSLVSGRKLGTPEPDAGGKIFRSLLETAKYAGDHLKGKVGGNLKDVNTTITALSRYNGGGNSNCQAGYPYPIPYGGCPRAFEGEDDPYPVSFVDPKHDNMYLLYCADHTACVPQIFERPGAFAVALNVYNSFTKSGYENSQLPPTQTNPSPSPSTAPDGSTTSTGFFPRSCGTESLSTALGCLPYTRDAFVSALLTFIVGLAGGIALVIMLIATFQIMTAGGNPQQLKKGKELLTSAIIGLLFLIFSVSLLRLVAGDIIKLPGF